MVVVGMRLKYPGRCVALRGIKVKDLLYDLWNVGKRIFFYNKGLVRAVRCEWSLTRYSARSILDLRPSQPKRRLQHYC